MKCLKHWQQGGKEAELTHVCRIMIPKSQELQNAMRYPRLDPGTEKGHLVEKLVKPE